MVWIIFFVNFNTFFRYQTEQACETATLLRSPAGKWVRLRFRI